ncbi:MAG: ATP-binding protein [Methanoregula sp.]
MEPPFISLDLVRSMIQNFTLIATLVLLYNFIPDTFHRRSKLAFSLSAGLIFGIAAAVSMPALWQTTGASAIGFNIILVPLAGFIGGPISALLVAGVLLAGCAVSNAFSSGDFLTVSSGVLLGALFYYAKKMKRFPRSSFVQYFLLGLGVVLIVIWVNLVEIGVSAFSFIQQPIPGPQSQMIELFPILPFAIISCGGTILLGYIIGFIDQKKQADKELLDSRDRLEGLVRERMTELRQANSLQKATIESTADGIVVTDRDGIIRAYNQKAAGLLKLPAHPPVDAQAIGIDARSIVGFLVYPDELLRLIARLPESAEQIVTPELTFTNGRICELYVQPQRIGDTIVGRVWSFHDITAKRLAEEAIAAANKKMILLSNITRHDILNQVTALSGHLELLDMKNRDTYASAHLSAMRKSLDVIQEQLEFTRDYQDLGLKKPEWQDAGASFTRAAEAFAGKNIAFSCETGHVLILADPMIGQVFYNLIDNSLRHGERVAEIRLSVKTDGPDLLIVYEDNGTGVVPEEKEKIFLKGFGKHTGLGMFLIKEILSITGITIRETGTWQQGVRFEIRVPEGKFRFP